MGSTITNENIKIEGITYEHIISVEINQKIGQHGEADLELEVEPAVGAALTSGIEVHRYVSIIAVNNGQSQVIFCGVIANAGMSAENQYPVLSVKLLSTSYLLDKEKRTRSYQIMSLTHEQVMNMAVENKATIHFEATDSPIGGWILQNNETNWEFIKRMASRCKAVVTVDVTQKQPTLTIGIPNMLLTGGIGRSQDGNLVKNLKTALERGELVTTPSYGEAKDFTNTPYHNPLSEGLMLTGVVQDVQKEKVKVFFDSIDSEYDPGTDNWFEYATPFATNGGEYGSGFYWMPEQGDRVRVFLPTAEEAAAFAFGSVSVSPLDNPVEAKWRVPNGQEILFTEDGIRITCQESSIYIDMNINSPIGISVFSDQNINIEEAETILIEGDEGVTLFADNKVSLYSSETNVEFDKDMIVFQAEKFHIN